MLASALGQFLSQLALLFSARLEEQRNTVLRSSTYALWLQYVRDGCRHYLIDLMIRLSLLFERKNIVHSSFIVFILILFILRLKTDSEMYDP